MAFKMNQISCDLASYPYYMLLSPRKFGKTTWWRNLVLAAWGNASKGLLISCGTESGFHHLDNLQVEEALSWDDDYDEETGHRGLVQIVDDLIENNADYGIKGVCFDTFDTLFDIATDEVMRESRRETGKSCKSINDAFGGYNRGSDRLIKIINDQLSRIRNAGSAKHETVDIPASKMKKSIAEILLNEGYIKSFQLIDDGTQGVIRVTLKYLPGKEKAIQGLRRVSKPGLRVYAGADELPRVLKGLGIAIISTSKGVMTDKQARKEHVGGEVLAFVW